MFNRPDDVFEYIYYIWKTNDVDAMQYILRDEMDVVQQEWQEMHKKQPDKNFRGIGFFKPQVIYLNYESDFLTHELFVNPIQDLSFGPLYKGTGEPGDCHDIGKLFWLCLIVFQNCTDVTLSRRWFKNI